MVKGIAQALMVALLGIWLWLYWPVVESLRERWTLTQNYSHGYIIVLVAAYFIYQRLPELRRFRAGPAIGPLLLLIPVGMLGFFGAVTQVQLLQQAILPLSLWLWVAAVFGWRIAGALLFPFALLYTTVPMWDFLVRPLRSLTVYATQHFIDAINVPALVIGNRIHLPSGIIEVEDGCSGHNFFMAAAVIGVVHAYWSFHSWSRRIAVVALAMFIGMISNWVRVILLVLIAHETEMRSSLIYDHVNFGWMVFAVFLFVYFALSRLLMAGDPLPGPRADDAPAATIPWGRAGAAAAVATAILAVFPAWLHWQAPRAPENYAGFPQPFQARAQAVKWLPLYEGFDVRQSWQINWQSTPYDMVALTWLQQRRDRKLIYFRNRIADENQIRQPERWAALGAGGEIRQLAINVPNGSRAVWWFYVIDGRITADNLRARWLMFTSFLRGDAHASLVALSTPCYQPACEREMQSPDAQALLQQIIARWSAEGAVKAIPTAAPRNG